MRHVASVTTLSVVSLLTVLAGCGRDERAEAPAPAADTSARGTPEEQPGVASAADTSPVNAQTWIDDVTIGTQVNPDGSIPADKVGDDFAPGQPVTVTMEVGDAPANTPVKVVWFGPEATKIGEETKNVTSGEKYLPFTAKDTSAWAKGDYRAEIWVGDEKVNEQHFNVTSPSKAAESGKTPDRG
jgi:hypothetical protein